MKTAEFTKVVKRSFGNEPIVVLRLDETAQANSLERVVNIVSNAFRDGLEQTTITATVTTSELFWVTYTRLIDFDAGRDEHSWVSNIEAHLRLALNAPGVNG